MELTQVKKLKLNARNIESTLISYNKSLRKIRLDETSFAKRQDLNQKRAEREENIEKPSRVQQAIEVLKSKLLSTPMSIFDKIKEFFGLVLMGLLVNNLPRIIKGLQKFFGNNPWIIDGLKQVIEFVGIGLSKLVEVVSSISAGTMVQVERNRKEIEFLINGLDSMFTTIESGLLGMISKASAPTPTQTPLQQAQRFAQSGGYGRYAPPQTQVPQFTPGKKYLPYQPLSTQPFAPGGKPAITPPQYSSPSPSNTPIQKLARGGTVKDVSQNSSGRISSKPRTFARPGGTAKGRKARKSINYFASFENNMALQSSVIATQQDNNNLFEKMIERFRELKSLKGDGKEKVTPGGGGGGGVDPGDIAVTGGSEDFWLLSLISLYENANPQGAADVAQSIYNRMANRGQSARQVILSENQYQPVRKFGGYNAWGLVVDKESALAHIKKYPGNSASAKNLDAVAKALLDPSKQADAAKFVGVRPDFRNEGYEGSNDEMTDDKSRLNHTFGFNRGGSRGKITKPASVPTFVNAEVISETTPTQLKGKNTAYQGSTGRSTGEHFHIGPSELLNQKTLRAENVGTTQGLVDARQAAFRVAKALIARKEKFIFSNSGVEIDPSKRLTDQQLRNYILQEQNAHMGRSMGSSWGGVDIAVYKSGMDVPIPVGKVVYHDDGFGFRARLIGTKGFVGHLTKGSRATPLDQIEKAKPIVKPEAVITPEKQKQ